MAEAKCFPRAVADLMTEPKLYDHAHVRRNLVRMCYSCPLYRSCDAQADREMASTVWMSHTTGIGFRAGLTPSERRRRIRKARRAA